ncbi:MAG: efflux RND transporter periplasmic adaptor subunit [Acidobacteria bacterium]|nr:efflux RND transporter periplasmic adaptor subunit [Acidobacteriota bacterium]MCA1611038.1 efflux RND transporter periplasmic adaptor subunit [Acidobacteriota bacterium]
MKKGIWVAVALAIGVAGAWGYGALVRQENDDGRKVRLLALAEEQRLDVSFSRSGRLISAVPDEGEAIQAKAVVARLEEPGLAEDISDLERQSEQVRARENARRQDVARLAAQWAQTVSEEKRLGRLAREGIAAAADLETLQHHREELAAAVRAREADKGELEAQTKALQSRIEKIQRFEREGTLLSPAAGIVLTRHHRLGEFVPAGDPIVTLQVEAPYLRVEVPEERLSAFSVGATVRVWPQARTGESFPARVLSVKPRSEFATRRNWGLQSRDLRTFSVRLKPEGAAIVSGQTFVVEAGS